MNSSAFLLFFAFVTASTFTQSAFGDGGPSWYAKTTVMRAQSVAEQVGGYGRYRASCRVATVEANISPSTEGVYQCIVVSASGSRFEVQLDSKMRLLKMERM